MIQVVSRRTTLEERRRANGLGPLIRWVASATINGSTTHGIGLTRRAAEREAVSAAKIRQRAIASTRRSTLID